MRKKGFGVKCLHYLLVAFAFYPTSIYRLEAQHVSEEEMCVANWAEYVGIAADIVDGRAKEDKYVILFVDENGNAFNCLNEDLSQGFLEKFATAERISAQLFMAIKNKGESGIPAQNYCNTGTSQRQNLFVITIYLPSQKETIELPTCKSRLQKLRENIAFHIARKG